MFGSRFHEKMKAGVFSSRFHLTLEKSCLDHRHGLTGYLPKTHIGTHQPLVAGEHNYHGGNRDIHYIVL